MTRLKAAVPWFQVLTGVRLVNQPQAFGRFARKADLMVQSSLWSWFALALASCGGQTPVPSVHELPLPAPIESAALDALARMDRLALQSALEQVESHLATQAPNKGRFDLAGRLAEALLDHPRALAYYREAELGTDPDLWLRKGTLELDAGDLLAASQDLERAQQLQADPARLHYQLGRLAEERGDATQARDAFLKSLGFAPARPEVHFSLSRVAAELGEGETAEHAMAAFQHWTGMHRLAKQASAEADARDAPKCEAAARAWYAAGEFDTAARWARRAMVADPDLYSAELILALAELEKGDLQGATERVDGLLQRAPDFAAARRERAWIYLRSGDAAAAVEAMNTALAHAPADGTGHYEQGLLLSLIHI